jgi:hypothetical protein
MLEEVSTEPLGGIAPLMASATRYFKHVVKDVVGRRRSEAPRFCKFAWRPRTTPSSWHCTEGDTMSERGSKTIGRAEM